MECSLARVMNDYFLRSRSRVDHFLSELEAFEKQVARIIPRTVEQKVEEISSILEDLAIDGQVKARPAPQEIKDIDHVDQEFEDLFAQFRQKEFNAPESAQVVRAEQQKNFLLVTDMTPQESALMRGLKSSPKQQRPNRKSLLQKLIDAKQNEEQLKKRKQLYENILQNNTLTQLMAKKDQIIKKLSGCHAFKERIEQPADDEQYLMSECDEEKDMSYSFKVVEVDQKQKSTPLKSGNLFAKKSGAFEAQQFRMGLKSSMNLFESPIKIRKKKTICNGKDVPEWAANLDEVAKTSRVTKEDQLRVFGQFCVQNLDLSAMFGEEVRIPSRTSSANWRKEQN